MERFGALVPAGLGACPGLAPWALDAGRLAHPWLQSIHGLLRMIESTYPLDELIHSWHVEAMRRGELAREPALERFTRESVRALHGKVAAAGWARRILMGEITAETVSLLAEHVRSYTAAYARAQTALRELAARPAAAQAPEIRVLRQLLDQAVQTARSQQMATAMVVGADPELAGTELMEMD